jgi:hypothetical protein
LEVKRLGVGIVAALLFAGCGGGSSTTTTLAPGRTAKEVASCLHIQDDWGSQVGTSFAQPHTQWIVTPPPSQGQPGEPIQLTDEDPQHPVQYSFRIVAGDGHAVDAQGTDIPDSARSAIYACAAST